MREWRLWLRSARGQLVLLGATLAAAVVLAGVIVGLRGAVFERYVRETYPPAGAWAQEVARDLSAPNVPPQRLEAIGAAVVERVNSARATRKSAQDLEELYGLWQLNPETDPDGLLAVRLTDSAPGWVIDRLRRTLAAGNAAQRAAAVRWLRAIADREDTADRVRVLAAQARRRAAARGEESIRLQAESVLASGRVADGR